MDKIDIVLSAHEQVNGAVERYRDYICKQVLGRSLVLADKVEEGVPLGMGDYALTIAIRKVEE